MKITFKEVHVASCRHSRFNTRKTRPDADVKRLADRIKRNGFENTRALWAVEVDGVYEIFAGGTRLEAAKVAGLTTVPVMLHEDVSEEEVARRADEDNENDEYHVEVSPLDVWAEYYRLWKVEGWTQPRIALAKQCSQPDVANRIGLHNHLPRIARRAVLDKIFDEGHCQAIIGLVLDIQYFSSWLTSDKAQTELVEEVLGKHRGKTSDDPSVKKPTVASVREKAKRWKEMIQAAKDCHAKLESEEWQRRFVDYLAKQKARTTAAVNEAYEATVKAKAEAAAQAAARARQAAADADDEARRATEEEARAAAIREFTGRIILGDAREAFSRPALRGFTLLLTDPPYGQDFQSQRRRVTPKKDRIANDDDLAEALALLTETLKAAHGCAADNATVLVFTGWRAEPDFRRAVEDAGFQVKGRLIWNKPNHGTGDLKGSFAPKHEAIIHAVKGSPELRQRHPDVLDGKDFLGSGHPTEKPLDLLRLLVEATTAPGDLVIDPFAGSGSALIAAHNAGRRFYGVELDEANHKEIVNRLYDMVAKPAEDSRQEGSGEKDV